MLRQSEKLTTLGTLAAGIAHELNNPAAAAQRGAGQLRPALQELERLCVQLAGADVEPEALARVLEMAREVRRRRSGADELSALERADRRGNSGAVALRPRCRRFVEDRRSAR